MWFLKKNDWVTTEEYTYNRSLGYEYYTVYFKIQYSKDRNKFRLKHNCDYHSNLLKKFKMKVKELNNLL